MEPHPWVAKSASYISLTRAKKADIIWNKIIEDDSLAPPVDAEEFFNIDLSHVFDEFGDELDCRLKTVHSQGNVAKAKWVNLGGHDYTGIFKGGDTGFVRLSTGHPVNENPDPLQGFEDHGFFTASVAVKFLRDGVDSANSFGRGEGIGQRSFNFFEKSLNSVVKGRPGPNSLRMQT